MTSVYENSFEWANSADGAQAHPLAHFVQMLQERGGGPQGYRLRRIILTNFWLYGQQEFEVPHGRLFLAGENASGKSTVLTAALPLGLDGDLRPNRLDTFGGRERRIEYYVLGGSDSATPYSHERRTAYIALEFEWCDPDHPPIAPEIRQRWENGEREKTRFLTIGVSIAGNANTTERIRPLRFLITDGARLGYEIDTLYETGTGNKHEKRAYDHIRFKQLLEEHGIVCDSQADYERQVARYLFGYNDVKDFEKLINLLLVLRRPNLSTELNFSRVHEYLKMSLPRIPGETTAHVIGTIERIDGIQSEIEHIQEAYDAAERVHRARQHLAHVHAQLAACEYSIAHQVETAIQQRVNRLRREHAQTEQERDRAAAHVESLQTEQYKVGGQIKALEASEGLQVATQFTLVRERQNELALQLQMQEQSLHAANLVVRENAANLARQRQRMEEMKAENASHLQELASVASGEALWETVAFQLSEAQRQLQAFSIESSAAPEMPLVITSLLGETLEERTAWLQRLENLHKQRATLDTQVQYARTLETTRFQELDEARRHFQSARERAYEAQQALDGLLKPFQRGEESDMDDEESREQVEEIVSDELLTGNIVEQFALALANYRQLIDRLEQELGEAADLVRGELDDLQSLTGGQRQKMQDLEELYEQKQAEPEVAPSRSARRNAARARLAEHNIAALPLYALLDFTPATDEHAAGRIEYMLEDAGLLDALVVPQDQAAAADAILASENLSDCRLDIAAISQHNQPYQAGQAGQAGQAAAVSALCFDASLGERQHLDWQPTARAILPIIQPYTTDDERVPVRYSMREDGGWTHGLLAGHAAPGPARYIGKATRIRARQLELAELDARRVQLESELAELTTRLVHYEQQLNRLLEQQAQVRKLLQRSGLEERYAELTQTRVTLESGRDKYQKARQQTQEMRQRYNVLIAQLERASEGNTLFASDATRVQAALLALLKLKNQARTLKNQLQTVSYTWREYQQQRTGLEQAQTNERNVGGLAERVRSQFVQVQAEMSELQRVAASSNAEELAERLQALRERAEALIGELDAARQLHTRFDERASNLADALAEVEGNLQGAQQERLDRETRFLDLLNAYPVEQLVQALQMAAAGEPVRAAQALVGGQREASAQKEALEGVYREAYSGLVRIFNHEQSLLLEYGPDLDDQGQVIFINENRCRPIELLTILSERIELQRTLLDEEERQLFEDFLLQEIAEAIRTQILEAEEWVQQINGVLSGLPMIGEHYALQWRPPAEYDMTKLGSHLAQHYRLLRKPAQSLTTEETETLMAAFRREIEAVRLRQQENPDTNFLEALEQVFDYREWFHFDVWVTPIGGQRQRLTDRIAGTRSGAEQLFALYVPLFAALGALYRSAAHGAPRLLALDEAFDKVSAANTQRIMAFLVSQDFQWIMTGPQVSGAGSKIPASARYLMIHEKGSPVATASASFWSDSQLDGNVPS